MTTNEKLRLNYKTNHNPNNLKICEIPDNYINTQEKNTCYLTKKDIILNVYSKIKNKIKIQQRDNKENNKNLSNIPISLELEKKNSFSFLQNKNFSNEKIKISLKNSEQIITNRDNPTDNSIEDIKLNFINKLPENPELNVTNQVYPNDYFTNRANLVNKEILLQGNPENNSFIQAKTFIYEDKHRKKSEILKFPGYENPNTIHDINFPLIPETRDFPPLNLKNNFILYNTNIFSQNLFYNPTKLNFKTIINGVEITSNSLLYSYNLENISINKSNPAIFSNEEYRRMFTRLIRGNLGNSLLENLLGDEDELSDFLYNQKINEKMRTKMVDWMIEVLDNYKCDNNTFFLAINTMDRYFKYISCREIQPNELHLIGVTIMFMASKYEDIIPLRLKTVQEKIAHKKLSIQEIKNKECEISEVLGYILGKPTQWDFINYFFEEIFYTNINNFSVNNKTLCEFYIPRENTGMEYEKELFKFYTGYMLELLRHVVLYLAKMNSHDYMLSGKKPSLVAASTIYVGLKICEQINKEEYVNQYFIRRLKDASQKTESEIVKIAQKILYNAQNFDVVFTGLENLKKIHFNAIIELKHTK